MSEMRWTVDEPEDFDFVTEVYKNLFPIKEDFTMTDILIFVMIDRRLLRRTHLLIAMKV